MNHIRLAVLIILSLGSFYTHSMEKVMTSSSATLEDSSAPVFTFSQSIELPSSDLIRSNKGVFSPDKTTILYRTSGVLKNFITGQEVVLEECPDDLWIKIEFRPETNSISSQSPYWNISNIHLWNSITGSRIVPKEYKKSLAYATVSPDRSTILTISQWHVGSDDTLRLWNTITQKEELCIPNLSKFLDLSPETHLSKGLFSPDGTSILIVADKTDDNITTSTLYLVTNSRTENVTARAFPINGYIRSVEFTDNHTIFISYVIQPSTTNVASLLKLSTGETLLTLNNPDYVDIQLNSAKKIISARTSSKEKFDLWNAITGAKFRELDNMDLVHSLSVSPDSKTALVKLYNQTIQLRSINTGEIIQTLSSTCDDKLALAFSSDGNSIFISFQHLNESTKKFDAPILTIWNLISPTTSDTPENNVDEYGLLDTFTIPLSAGTEKNQQVEKKSSAPTLLQKQETHSTSTSSSTSRVDKTDKDHGTFTAPILSQSVPVTSEEIDKKISARRARR